MKTKRRHLGRKTRDTWPLDAPGMPPPGPDFLFAAQALEDGSVYSSRTKGGQQLVEYRPGPVLRELYARALREPGFELSVEVRPGHRRNVTFVPGHIWGQHAAAWRASMIRHTEAIPVDGPHPADVMVIGKMPWREETAELRNLVGASGAVLADLIKKNHIEDALSWYVTNLVKFQPPDDLSDLKAGWIADCKPLLAAELRIVRPKYILCLGADATKAILGKKFTVTYMDGRVLPFEFPVHRRRDDEPEIHRCRVMTVLHPVEASREPPRARQIERGLGRFALLISGVDFDKAEEDLDHRVIDTLEDAEEWTREVDAFFASDPKYRRRGARLLAWDAEWQGQHPINEGSYLRTIQASWAPKHAACFKLRHAGGKRAFRDAEGRPAEGRLMKLLSRFCRDKRAVGHFLVSDLEWFRHAGFDPTASCPVPIDPRDGKAAWERFRAGEGWLDTGMIAHAIEETAMLGLESLAMRYTTVPRYDIPMEDWKKAYCARRKIKAGALEGYGDADDAVLLPYACLHGDSLVQLSDETWETIRSLVVRRYDGKVRAFLDGRVVDARVVGWHRRDVGQKDWFRLQTVGAQRGRWGLLGPIFTPDHEVYTRRGKVRVDALLSGRDAILTEEREFSPEQLSVLLGSLLGDGGYIRQHDIGVGFGFSQRPATAAYADWKADVFSTHAPALQPRPDGFRRYHLPFSRYLAALSRRFQAKPCSEHGRRKAYITADLLEGLGDLGLAVWYQDDGTLVTDKRGGRQTSRIYCRISAAEADLVVGWLTTKFGQGVRYNTRSGFLQISRAAFRAFQDAIAPFIHPAMAYKGVRPRSAAYAASKVGAPYYDPIVAVVPYEPSAGRRGHGVRYCLTVEGAHNFLTKAGFVSNCYDSDSTLRLVLAQLPLLDRDYEGNCSWEPAWESMIAQPVILDMHENGILVDRERIDRLTDVFFTQRAWQQEEIRHWARWPNFNIRSTVEVREFLFGEKLNGKVARGGKSQRARPVGARSLYVEPLLDTSKPPRRWDELKAKGLTGQATPGTGKAILAILAQDNLQVADQIGWLRDYRFLDQVLKSVLRPPTVDEDGTWLTDEEDYYSYGGGLAACIDDDGRVRTHMRPTAETGRWKHSRPNLANFSKQRDPDYKRMLGENYPYKLRSILMASPGYALVEFDYTGAELYGMALMAGDARMIEHAERALHPDEGFDAGGRPEKGGKHPHPDYYDIHSNVAVLAFRLDCVPTKAGLKAIGKIHFRTLAKNVIFGIAYGRGAKAIALQAKEQGVAVTPEEAQLVIDAIFAMYPGLVPFFAEAKRRATEDKWLCHCFGRRRRFPSMADYQLAGEFERQAMNFPIQGMIASAVDRGLARLHREVHAQDMASDVRLLLQLHDAGLLEVRYHLLEYVVDELIPYAMRDCVPIYPTTLDGTPTGAGPFHLGLDITVEKHWSEKFSKEECAKLGIPARFAA